MNKIKIWVRFRYEIVNTIHSKGTYHLSKSDLKKKYEDCLDIYLPIYEWYAEKTETMTERPIGANYQILVSTTRESVLSPTEGFTLLELEVNSSDVIVTDAVKWSYILNYNYLPTDDEDLKKFKTNLEAQGISSQSKAFMSNFYPELKDKILKSWDRLFDDAISFTDETKATVWEIKKEWIINEIKA